MEILIVPEVAAALRISETQVYRLIAAGHIKAINAGARRRVVSREELDAFIRGGGVHGNPEPVDGAPSQPPAPSTGRPRKAAKAAS